MDTVTYPDKKVVEVVNKYSIPLKVGHDTVLDNVDRDVKWTPQLFLAEPSGKLLADSMGFLPPLELAPWILLGNGRLEFQKGNMNKATNLMNIVVNDYPDSHWAPEAMYLSCVALFNDTHEPEALKKAYTGLTSRYPQSIWSLKAQPYRLL
ncbi:MAG TPA: hypothetical protein DHV36_18535 [Desulfobacteraceae bacterium]|nr:hypothetical protein [Desulfobacteraceae bacterium]